MALAVEVARSLQLLAIYPAVTISSHSRIATTIATTFTKIKKPATV
jgi:hypothetical protein